MNQVMVRLGMVRRGGARRGQARGQSPIKNQEAMMFEPKAEISEAVKSVMELLSKKDRGETLYYRELAKIGIDREAESYQTVMRKVRNLLLRERNIAVLCEPGVGFRLLTSKEQVQECSRNRSKRIRNQANRGIAEVRSAPDEELPDSLRLLKTRQVQEMRNTRANAWLALKDLKETSSKTESLPRRPY